MDQEIIIKYLAGELDEDSVKELRDWIRKEESNRKYFLQVKNLYLSSTINITARKTDLDEEFRIFKIRRQLRSSEKVKNTRSFFNSGGSVGTYLWRAAVILLLLTGFTTSYLVYQQYIKNDYNELTTRLGEKTQITLSDGTKIWLNSATKLRYPSNLNKSNVNVYLDGEAFFNVNKKSGRTFVVHASTIQIAVLGTSFNVKSYNEENSIETTLEKGSISITGEMGGKQIKKPLLLSPNQQLTFKKGLDTYQINQKNDPSSVDQALQVTTQEPQPKELTEVTIETQIDPKLYSSWKDGKLIFKSERFDELIIEMERWYNVQIKISDEKLKEQKYTGVFENETIEQALTALSLSLPFHFDINRNIVSISKLNDN